MHGQRNIKLTIDKLIIIFF